MHEKARHEVENETSKRKRGRPAKNSEKEKECTDEEIFKLIDLWENHECLHNTKSSAYLNKDKWSHAIDKFVQAFQDKEKPPTKSQVQLKITRWRNYYGGENNKVENSKTSGGDLDSVYIPTWKFFDSLEFLKDKLVARPTKSNLEDDDSWLSNPSIYNSDNPPLLSLSGRWCRARSPMPKKQFPIDDMSKAKLRLELQQKIIQLKYSGYQAVPSSSVPIDFFCLFVCFFLEGGCS